MHAKQIICTVILVAAVVFKFWLIAEMEITDDTDDPVHYMEQILLHKGACYGPGTGDVGKFFYELGIPFRPGIEVGFLLATLLVIKALFEWPTQSGLALALYLFVIFNPAVEELLSHLMSDQVWLVEILAGFSLFVFFTGTSSKMRWISIALASLCLGFSTITRSTFVPLLAIFLVWALIGGALAAAKSRRLEINFPVVGGFALCLYAVALFYYSTCFMNSRYNGFFGLTAFDSREYQRFYMCLQSVGEPTGDRYYPVDDRRLKLIAQAGPRSSWFVEQLGKDYSFRRTSLETYGKPGIALCWFHWAVFETIDTDGDLPRTFALFKDVENEIAQAAEEKRLNVRPILPLPDCRLSVVRSALPAAFAHVASLITVQPSRYAWAWNSREPRFDDPDFSRSLHRTHVTPSPFREQIGLDLCAIYSRIYAPLLPCLAVALLAFFAGLIRRWSEMPAFSSCFLSQQIFLVAFVVFYLWYVLFDASGLLAVPRYLVFNNVMLPLLLVYYARRGYLLLADKSGARGVEVLAKGIF
jgi:hypothetical protein